VTASIMGKYPYEEIPIDAPDSLKYNCAESEIAPGA